MSGGPGAVDGFRGLGPACAGFPDKAGPPSLESPPGTAAVPLPRWRGRSWAAHRLGDSSSPWRVMAVKSSCPANGPKTLQSQKCPWPPSAFRVRPGASRTWRVSAAPHPAPGRRCARTTRVVAFGLIEVTCPWRASGPAGHPHVELNRFPGSLPPVRLATIPGHAPCTATSGRQPLQAHHHPPATAGAGPAATASCQASRSGFD